MPKRRRRSETWHLCPLRWITRATDGECPLKNGQWLIPGAVCQFECFGKIFEAEIRTVSDKQWMSQRRVDYPFPMASESDEGREGGEGEGEGEEGEGGREGLLQIPNKKYKARASQRKTAKRSVSECSDSEDQVDLKKLMEKVKMLENQIIRQQYSASVVESKSFDKSFDKPLEPLHHPLHHPPLDKSLDKSLDKPSEAPGNAASKLVPVLTSVLLQTTDLQKSIAAIGAPVPGSSDMMESESCNNPHLPPPQASLHNNSGVKVEQSSVELVPGCGVYLTQRQLEEALQRSRDSPSRLVRRLVGALFPPETLAGSSVCGKGKHSALDDNTIQACIRFVMSRFGSVSKSKLVDCINDMCTNQRRKSRRHNTTHVHVHLPAVGGNSLVAD